MQKFVLQRNVSHFRDRLAEAHDEATRKLLRVMLSAAERELTLLESQNGAWDHAVKAPSEASRAAMLASFEAEYGVSDKPAALIDPAPGLPFAAANRAYLEATGRTAAQLVGQPVFIAFPDNPDDATADGMSNLYASLRRAAKMGRPDPMPDQRYDVSDVSGAFTERYWRPVNTPLMDDDRQVVFILHRVDDVTEEVKAGNLAPKARG